MHLDFAQAMSWTTTNSVVPAAHETDVRPVSLFALLKKTV
jgi:hypothetical protein